MHGRQRRTDAFRRQAQRYYIKRDDGGYDILDPSSEVGSARVTGLEVNHWGARLRTDTYRASGAGGQHINKTDSAVRLTHIPTGIVVQCQDGRSQHSNRDVAWRRLRSRLYDHEMRKRLEEQQKLEDTKTDVGWGHQIRSYVLDQSRIKDLRTNVEISNTQKGLDGDLDALCAEARLDPATARDRLATPAALAIIREQIEAVWLADYPDEPGAARYRVRFTDEDPHKGTGLGYLAKYVAKNIDGAGDIGAEHVSEAIQYRSLDRARLPARA